MPQKILIRAEGIANLGCGLYELTLENEPLSETERDVIKKLFPDFQNQIKSLMTQQALLNRIQMRSSPNELMTREELVGGIDLSDAANEPYNKKAARTPKT